MNRLAMLAASAAVLVAAPAAAAPYLYTFTTDHGSSGSIYFTIAGNGAGVPNYVSGTVNGSGITGLSPYANADNNYDPSVPHFSFGGFSVSTASGIKYNFYYNGADFLINSVASPAGYEIDREALTETIRSGSAVPEPATWAMMLLGFGMVGYGLRRRAAPTVRVAYA